MSLTLQRIEFRGVRKSKGLKRFAEKRILDWANRFWSSVRSPLEMELAFLKPGEGHQVLCLLTIGVEGKTLRITRYATNPYQALMSCLEYLRPQERPFLPLFSGARLATAS